MNMKNMLGGAVLAACAAFCTASEAAVHEGLEYSTTAVEPGVWSTQFSKCKRYAEKNGIPLVVFWVNNGCSHCKKVCNSIAESSSFRAWQKKCGYMFVIGIGREAGKKAYNFSKYSGTDEDDSKTILRRFPFCAVYCKPAGDTTSPMMKTVFTADGFTADGLKKNVKSALKNYVLVRAKAGTGGKAATTSYQRIGKRVTLVATPKSGYRFDGWYRTGTKDKVSSKTTKSVKVKGKASYTAKFKRN